jgi:hypothetical protein
LIFGAFGPTPAFLTGSSNPTPVHSFIQQLFAERHVMSEFIVRVARHARRVIFTGFGCQRRKETGPLWRSSSRLAFPSCTRFLDRSSPSRVRFAAQQQRALDCCGPFQETPSFQGGKAQNGKGPVRRQSGPIFHCHRQYL